MFDRTPSAVDVTIGGETRIYEAFVTTAPVTLDRPSFYVGAPEANWTITVSAPTTTCTWTAVSDSAWLIVKSTIPVPPAGSGSVAVRAATNITHAFRVGRITIGGVVYTVSQEP